MYTARQSLYVKGSAGDPLPTVFESLAAKGTNILRGQLVLFVAASGVGKSAFVLTYAIKSKVPTLYFSADSNAFTQLSRSMSILTGKPLAETSALVRAGRLNGSSTLLDDLPIRYNYEASPTLDMMGNSVKAFKQLYGEPPALVVVDNITNVLTKQSEEDPFAGLEVLMEELHKLARDDGSCVVGLHHATGPYNDGNIPIPMKGVKGQICRVPEVVLTMHRVQSEFGPDLLNVSTVKNRNGKEDATGMSYVSLAFQGDTMQIKDL